MFFRIKPSVNAVLPAIVLGFSLLAQAERPIPCSNASLRGDYSFSISGDIQPPSGPAIEVHGVALTHFDGQGNIVNTDHLVRNGTLPPVDWRPGTGSYVVHENCTGEAHINNEAVQRWTFISLSPKVATKLGPWCLIREPIFPRMDFGCMPPSDLVNRGLPSPPQPQLMRYA